jgi:hypothetical protein
MNKIQLALSGKFVLSHDLLHPGSEWRTESLLKTYPGNYVVEEYYDHNTAQFIGRLKFNTTEDEMWFRLKYA